MHFQKLKVHFILNIESGSYLSSQEATLQVLSAQVVFTTVFGMGTGGILPPGHRKIFFNFPNNFIQLENVQTS